MRYFKDTVPVKVLFPTMSNCQVSYFSLPSLAYGEIQAGDKSFFVDVRVAVVQSSVRKKVIKRYLNIFIGGQKYFLKK